MLTKGIVTWDSVTTPDSKYNCWSITIEVSKEEADKLKAVGLSPKLKEVDDALIRTWKCSRYQVKRGKGGGGKNPAPVVVDAELNPFSSPLGKGSEVVIQHRPYPWDNKHGKGVGSDLQGVQVVNYVEPEISESEDGIASPVIDDGEGFGVVAGGFVAPKQKAKKKEEEEVFVPDETKEEDELDF